MDNVFRGWQGWSFTVREVSWDLISCSINSLSWPGRCACPHCSPPALQQQGLAWGTGVTGWQRVLGCGQGKTLSWEKNRSLWPKEGVGSDVSCAQAEHWDARDMLGTGWGQAAPLFSPWQPLEWEQPLIGSVSGAVLPLRKPPLEWLFLVT